VEGVPGILGVAYQDTGVADGDLDAVSAASGVARRTLDPVCMHGSGGLGLVLVVSCHVVPPVLVELATRLAGRARLIAV